MRRLGFAGVAALAVATAGCAASSPGAINAAGTRVLAPAVQHLREVAHTGNVGALRAAVHQFQALVRQEQQRGDITASRATALLDAADILLQDAKPSPSPTPTVVPTSTSPTPTPTSASPTPPPTTPPPTTPPPTSSSPSPVVSASVAADGTPAPARSAGAPAGQPSPSP
ncbi:MAG: hypothetical protein JO222_06530 [Frankiales bacterium]|nr:hypothetical protein [Frankiales bacterium]